MVIVNGQRRNRVRSRGGGRGREIVSIRDRDVVGGGVRVKVMCRARIATEVLDTHGKRVWFRDKVAGRLRVRVAVGVRVTHTRGSVVRV